MADHRYVFTRTSPLGEVYGVMWNGKSAWVTYARPGGTHAWGQAKYYGLDGLSCAIAYVLALMGERGAGDGNARALAITEAIAAKTLSKAHRDWLDGGGTYSHGVC